MSGIVGIFSFNGSPIQSHQIQKMMSMISHRGPHGAGIWMNDQVGFGHVMLHTTPESLSEIQPVGQGQHWITADARLDNRDELIQGLGLKKYPGSEITDSQIILEAYEKWGAQCTHRLRGDYAFAIWDGIRRELFCARDVFGVKPFYYFASDDWFIFGSEIKAILTCPQPSRRINESRLAGFFYASDLFEDKETTIFSDISLLPPAHSIRVTPSEKVISCYWTLDPEREIQMKSEDEYAEATRHYFVEAVRSRVRSAFPIGSTVSGGIDSSSIACTMRFLKTSSEADIHTFSAIFKDAPDADESEYASVVTTLDGFRPHIVHPDRQSPFVDLERVLWHMDEPFYGTNYVLPWSVYRCASENNIRILLDGSDGDTTISHGLDYFEILAQQEKWLEFSKEAKAVSKKFANPGYANQKEILYSFGTPQLTRWVHQGQLQKFVRGIREIHYLYNIPQSRLAINWGIKPLVPDQLLNKWRKLRGRPDPEILALDLLTPEFAEKIRKVHGVTGDQSSNHLPMKQNNGHMLHYEGINTGMLPYSLQLMDHLSAAFGLEMRYPFCDQTLVEFCLAVPPEYKLKQGWSRYYFRKAMAGILPDQVRWRPGKTDLSKVFPYMIDRYAREYVEDLLENPPQILTQFVSIASIKKLYNQYWADGHEDDLLKVWQTVIFATWFKQNLTSG